jgi:PAS domain S-box-containing protein
MKPLDPNNCQDRVLQKTMKPDLDEQQRRGLQEYIFDLEESKEKAEELSLAHEKLKRLQDLLLSVLSCTVHGLCLIKDRTFVWCNKALTDMFGWDHDELTGKTLGLLCPDTEEYKTIREAAGNPSSPDGLLVYECELMHKSGRRVPCLVMGRALSEQTPSEGYVISVTDFTERRLSQEALKRAFEELERRSAELERSNEQLNGEIEERKCAEEKLKEYQERLEQLVEARTIQLTTVNEHLNSEIATRRDVEQSLRKSEDAYRAIFENTGTATVIIEEDMIISLANAEYAKLSGFHREEIEGRKKWTEFVVEEDLERMREYYRLRRSDTDTVIPRQYEFRFKNRSDEIRHVLLTVAMIPGSGRRVASLLDITEQKRMEAEALKAEKLESLGVLAGGIAHDFNNILTGVLGNISLAKTYAKAGDKIEERLDEMERASLRARDLTQQLLTFSRGGKPVKKTAPLPELIKDCATFALRGSNVMLELSFPGDLWPVEVDEGQIGQVINNLVINARQAMPGGGMLRIEAENVVMEPSSGFPLQYGRYVRTAIRDQGMGIPKKHIDKIFDPYFTTKQEGSGLGLATVYSIVGKHGGHICVDSEMGIGTRFCIYLSASTNSAPQTADSRKEFTIGSTRVLVMEDEELVQEVLSQMLQSLGCEVALARDGVEAIRMYRESKSLNRPFDVVIMDLTIPGGMGGKEAIRHLLEIDPQVKAIVSSGYSNDPVMADYRKYGFAGVVSKPYTMREISAVLCKVASVCKTLAS